MRELLQQVRVIDPVSATDRVADVLIEGGTIAAIADTIPTAPDETLVYNCQGQVLLPGLVDLYSHSGEPGFEERETLDSLSRAAAAGGFTRVAVLPDTVPAIDRPATVLWFQEQQKHLSTDGVARSRCFPWGALTVGHQGEQMTELAELATTGIVGFADSQPLQNLLLVQRVLEYARPLNQPLALWAYNLDLAGKGVMREGPDALLFGLPGISETADTSAIAALIECVAATGTPVHFMRIATARAVDLLKAGKDRGLPITASTTWLHLLLNTQAVGTYDPSLHLCPPLGTPADQAALLQAVDQGIIDAIAIDHTPHTYEDKTVAFAEAPVGAIGLELALPLLWQALVASNHWSPLTLVQALSTAPARCLGQTPPAIAPGQPTELALFAPDKTWTVEARSLQSKATNTPWLGQEIQGKIIKSWCATA